MKQPHVMWSDRCLPVIGRTPTRTQGRPDHTRHDATTATPPVLRAYVPRARIHLPPFITPPHGGGTPGKPARQQQWADHTITDGRKPGTLRPSRKASKASGSPRPFCIWKPFSRSWPSAAIMDGMEGGGNWHIAAIMTVSRADHPRRVGHRSEGGPPVKSGRSSGVDHPGHHEYEKDGGGAWNSAAIMCLEGRQSRVVHRRHYVLRRPSVDGGSLPPSCRWKRTFSEN